MWGHVGCVDSPELEMPHDGNTVQAPVGLSLEGFNKAVEIDGKVIPASLFPVRIRTLDKEGFDLEFIISRRNHDTSFRLHI